MTTATDIKPLTPRQIEALRYLAKYPHNPLRPDQVEAGTLGMLRRRGLVGKAVEGRGKGQRTTSPLTAAGCAVLDAADGPSWSVTMRNHLYHSDDPTDEPAYFRYEFPGATAAEAHAAAVAYGEERGDCSPVEDVAEVEGPLSAPSGEGVAL